MRIACKTSIRESEISAMPLSRVPIRHPRSVSEVRVRGSSTGHLWMQALARDGLSKLICSLPPTGHVMTVGLRHYAVALATASSLRVMCYPVLDHGEDSQPRPTAVTASQ